jgi:hypothetical protein
MINANIIGGVAQLGERLVRIQEVMGSNPTVSTNMELKDSADISCRAFSYFTHFEFAKEVCIVEVTTKDRYFSTYSWFAKRQKYHFFDG